MRLGYKLCVFVLAVLCHMQTTQAQGPLQEILKDWKQKERDFATVRVTYVNREIYPPGMTLTENGQGNTSPLTRTQNHELVFDANRGRYSMVGPRLDPATDKVTEYDVTYTFDGHLQSNLTNVPGITRTPIGSINTNKTSLLGDGFDYHTAPLFYAFRPATPSLQGFDLLSGEFQSVDSYLDGQKVKILESKYFDLVLRPDMRHSVVAVKWYSTRSGQRKLWYQLKIAYSSYSGGGFVPESWTMTKFGRTNRRPEMQMKGEILDLQVNTKVRDSEFSIDFPPGTKVNDASTGERYVVQQDFAKRQLKDKRQKSGKLSSWPILLLGITVSGLAVFCFMRWVKPFNTNS